jgi:hypothetical protein
MRVFTFLLFILVGLKSPTCLGDDRPAGATHKAPNAWRTTLDKSAPITEQQKADLIKEFTGGDRTKPDPYFLPKIDLAFPGVYDANLFEKFNLNDHEKELIRNYKNSKNSKDNPDNPLYQKMNNLRALHADRNSGTFGAAAIPNQEPKGMLITGFIEGSRAQTKVTKTDGTNFVLQVNDVITRIDVKRGNDEFMQDITDSDSYVDAVHHSDKVMIFEIRRPGQNEPIRLQVELDRKTKFGLDD